MIVMYKIPCRVGYPVNICVLHTCIKTISNIYNVYTLVIILKDNLFAGHIRSNVLSKSEKIPVTMPMLQHSYKRVSHKVQCILLAVWLWWYTHDTFFTWYIVFLAEFVSRAKSWAQASSSSSPYHASSTASTTVKAFTRSVDL